ncbi:ATPase (plasmid) [Azospirillum sp. TSH58]|uniref:BCAM0308 family protein n=1 Tax=Azospirillum sp. TSH58 TaxID=664962 RepID=UPI000D6011DC|nr:BCAM0308 family protein [Azospirillum sp. TSH58]AWJ87983.1 ATPase [Azospirillum sp. TSH58]PWC67496.1 ATPase [Azospirillum sp. TSH58]
MGEHIHEPRPRDQRPQPARRDRLIQEHVHDPYKRAAKLSDPTVCPQCGAVYHHGRWSWGLPAVDAVKEVCQACHRANDRYPAGTVTLSGGFLGSHRDEILAAVHHQERLEKDEHPLHRIIDVEDRDGNVVVTTTDVHLPRRIGEALHHAYAGDLDFHYDKDAYYVRVAWKRD